MNTRFKNKLSAFTVCALTLISLTFTSCKKEDEKTEDKTAASGYLVGYRTSGDQTSDYLLNTTNLNSGVISATGNGFELGGWSYYGVAGKTLFALDYTNNICIGYRVNEGNVTEQGRFAFERMDCMTEVDDNTLLAIGAPWGGGSFDCQIQLIDANSISINKKVKTPIYVSHDSAGAQLNAWPTHAYINAGKLYVSFYPLNGVSWETKLTDTAYVSVYSYPALEYLHTFKDTRTGPIGYYGSSPAMVEDESGNHYSFSTSSIAGGFTQSTKPSGLLRINKGAEQFDKDYFFNTEALGYRVLTGAYAGNGKIVARVVSVDIDKMVPAWAAFEISADICKIAILDVNTQSLTIVDDIPTHGGQYQTPFHIEGGKVYMSVTSNQGVDAYVYAIDATTAKATKGARIEGQELQSFFKY